MHILLVEIYSHTCVPTHTDVHTHTPQAHMCTHTHTQTHTHVCTHRHPYCRWTGKGPFPLLIGAERVSTVSWRTLLLNPVSRFRNVFSQVAAPPNLCWQKGPQSSRLSERQVGEKLQSCCDFHVPHSRHILPQHVTEALSDQEKLCCHLCQTKKSYTVISVRPGKATLSSLSDQERLRCHLCQTRKSDLVISVRPGEATLSSLSD